MLHDTINPHGKFFRSAMSDPKVARDLLKVHISSDIASHLDWDTMKLVKKSFIKEHLRHVHSDVIYQCELKEDKSSPIYLYCLLDSHESPDFFMPFHMLQYRLDLMEYYVDQGNEYLPVIINTCIYTGKTPYNISSQDIYDCFHDPDLARTHGDLYSLGTVG